MRINVCARASNEPLPLLVFETESLQAVKDDCYFRFYLFDVVIRIHLKLDSYN